MDDATDATPFEGAYDEAEPMDPYLDKSDDQAPDPPDIGEALSQMNSRLDAMSERLPASEDDTENLLDRLAGAPPEDGWDDSQYAYNPALAEPDGEDPAVAQIRELFNEEINERMQPYVDRIEEMNREQQLLSLADQYPRLREPEVLDAVAAEAQQMAQAYGNPGMETDPRLIQQLYLAHEAASAAQAAQDEPPKPAGAALETGAGPGEPEDDVDPVVAAYLDAAKPQGNIWE